VEVVVDGDEWDGDEVESSTSPETLQPLLMAIDLRLRLF
jgi:hypothetical protein